MSRTLSVKSSAIPVVDDRPALVPVRLSGHEGMNSLFEYHLLLKTPDTLNPSFTGAADFDLGAFLGHEISCSIELELPRPLEPTPKREINAIITAAELWGEEGRHIQYRLTLRPWLYVATQTVDCKVFQDMTVVQIIEELIAGHHRPVDMRLRGLDKTEPKGYPVRDYQTQFNESDFDFFSRLCESWGIHYYFEHSEGRHRLILCDHLRTYRQNPHEDYQEVEYHPPGWKADQEYLHSVVSLYQLTSAEYATRDYDYTRSEERIQVHHRAPRDTTYPRQEVYEWHAAVGGSHFAQPRAGQAGPNDFQAEGELIGRRRLEALLTPARRTFAKGNLRGIAPGHFFKLENHPRGTTNVEWMVLASRFSIEETPEASQINGAAADRSQHWQVSVELTLHPRGEYMRPEPTRSKPANVGPQTALVVGPDDQNTWTDLHGRIKIQFPWDRVGKKNERSSCWVRVASPWAGNQLGARMLPRIGQEVLIDFIGGDPDLPICTASVHNQMNMSPWALPMQSALTGLRSRELTPSRGNSATGRSNHLVLDDTEGQIQAQLKSDHLSSSLCLGYNTRIEDNAGRQEGRGEGFELRSDGHGVIRAQGGILITTEARTNASGPAKALEETASRLKFCHHQQRDLCSAARQAEGIEVDPDEIAPELLAQADAIQGTTKTPDHLFPEIAEPHLVLASPQGIAASTAGSTHLASLQHNALTSGASTSISTGRSLLVRAKRAIRLFAYDSVIKLVAAREDIDLVALKASIGLLARLKVTVTAEKISIVAKEELEIGGGGSHATFNRAGIETMTPGDWRLHSKSVSVSGAAAKSFSSQIPSTSFAGCLPSAQSAAMLQGAIVFLD